ncbi:MAG: hypothetical protein U0Q12_02835 [Vicinamibacterales bacterium]
MLEVTGVSKLPDAWYPTRAFIAFDPAADVGPGEPYLLEPNTTTFVDAEGLTGRKPTGNRRDHATIGASVVVSVSVAPAPEVTTGRAALVEQAGCRARLRGNPRAAQELFVGLDDERQRTVPVGLLADQTSSPATVGFATAPAGFRPGAGYRRGRRSTRRPCP